MQKTDTSPPDATRTLWYLRKIPFFSGISPDRVRALAEELETREVAQRQVVYLPGDPGDRVFFLVGGRVKCSKVSRDGKELILAYRRAGDMFGELCVLDGAPREEMVEAVKSAIVVEVPRETFAGLLLEDAALAFEFARIVGQRRRAVEHRVEHLIFRDVSAKLAALLLDLAAEFGTQDGDGVRIDLRITHQEMANLVGSTLETVSMMLAQFRKRGIVETDARTLRIVDPQALRALS
ncbi:MAG: Crp/Fnr family transcriptional regulator [Deltaproteobacteria bacterium]|nr:MAG: Crp/Fnr family transcriptional regulator [Deltaproteobacteria bacterium]